MTRPGLGRRGHETDPRNLLPQHRALTKPPTRLATPNRKPWWRPSTVVFDQGQTSKCTVEAAIGCAITRPFRVDFTEWPDYDTEPERDSLYDACERFDPPEWGPGHDGRLTSSPLKELYDRRIIGGYKWLVGEPELREWVQYYGPAIIGINWTEAMFYPDAQHVIEYTGLPVGGHAIEVVYYSHYRDAYRLVNSWGFEWGDKGRCWLSRADMDHALQDAGEAVTLA